MQRQATPKFFSSAGKYMPKKRARLKNFRVNYDTNGNMITDTGKGVTSVVYNHLNMPTQINVSGSKTGVVNYRYDANGIKQRKQTTENGTTITREYAGGFVYRNGTLEFINTTEGYIEPTDAGFRYVYNITDQLDNVRVSFSDTDADGTIDADTEIFETADFYPFGLKFGRAANVNRSSNYGLRYKTFQGQEVTEELGLNIHEWKYRISDPAIGRFWQVDPLAEKYEYQTVYQFSSNQPIHAPELEGLESSLDLNHDRWSRQYLNGEITKEQYWANHKAGAQGALAATSVVLPGPEDAVIGAFVASKVGGAVVRAVSSFVRKIFGKTDNVVDTAVDVSKADNVYKPNRKIENDPKTGKPKIDNEAKGKEHTQLGEKNSSNTGETYAKRRTLDKDGNVVKEVDFTDHGRPQNHTNPHQHRRDPNTGKRLPAEKLDNN